MYQYMFVCVACASMYAYLCGCLLVLYIVCVHLLLVADCTQLVDRKDFSLTNVQMQKWRGHYELFEHHVCACWDVCLCQLICMNM